jgi:hypothetical protein
MTAIYTPEVAATRKYLEWTKDWRTLESLSDISKQSLASNIALLLADHARLAEEAVKLRRVAKAAHGLSFGVDWNRGTHSRKYRPKLLAALAALEVQNG